MAAVNMPGGSPMGPQANHLAQMKQRNMLKAKARGETKIDADESTVQ
jgi:hypothetical protein